MFFNAVDDEMRKLFITDKDKHDILLWIIYQANYQETYKDLKLHQCYISLRTLSEQTKVEYSKAKRIINKLLKDGYISYVFKSKNQYKPSIIQCNFIEAKTGLKHQEVVSQASEKPKPSNKSTNNKKQPTGAQEDLDYKLGYIESSLEFTREFRDTELAELKEVDMKIIERVCEEMRGETDISPFVFLLDLQIQKCKRGIN